MLLDISRDHSLLPRGKPAANELLGRRAALLQAQQLMRQHAAEGSKVQAQPERTALSSN
jgi:geranylgeranyl pyrophosphate synthase